ncbi:hypothetical protein IGL98_000824 [Enterococcus sp. DIV0840]|uniref:capsular polysaccharide synthesis protein n=1 Tax=Enterococcus TaxID=1350 RepID=UPI001A8D85FC|nr:MULTISPECIES: capsular polysaccharide synthesis protein [Enterococcus]MBO0434084.1 capsular polysaccharide synthesis protein [Enterococcus sp. DIV0849a]MBO0472989.1 capsular polysaccharide synthesis protein [Enterococcus ureasiticus]
MSVAKKYEGIKKVTEKHNLLELAKSYFFSGTLAYSITSLLLNGFDKSSVEYSRLGIQNKSCKKMKSKYKKILNYTEPLDSEVLDGTNTIWFCWLQGVENAPELVKKCYIQLVNLFPNKKIVVITAENYEEYTNFPEFIITKWKMGIITNTHFSDLLRAELLYNHGGTWIDSTVYFSSNNISKVFFEADLFFFQKLKPGRDGSRVSMSSWFLTVNKKSLIIFKTRELLFSYWEKKNYLVDYYLFHIFFTLSCEKYQEEFNKVPKYCNSIPHVLLLEFFTEYDSDRFEDIKGMTSIHKLSYKFSELDLQKESTFYKYLINLEVK